ncbi:hypothetical protein OG195_44760 (plasmid) [Streptomyces sp. NBC_01362]|uniref:hypothetical protein n=1 Tax=Streptomyces sp. NBC_01362 TaxID=2903839 RepID=UPI002E36D380|nr:hypothetical protein [Streptomyces sp. NBC_01362]
MTGQPRTRLERVRASVGIASLALQQIEDADHRTEALPGRDGAVPRQPPFLQGGTVPLPSRPSSPSPARAHTAGRI